MNGTKYANRIARLKSRRQDSGLLLKSYTADEALERMTERFERAQYPESVRYALGSMEQVDDAYTKNTYAEGDRIAKHLQALPEQGIPVEFTYQGSVTNNTHIKVYSDIDLLVVIGRFYTLEPPLKPTEPYKGNPVDDLLDLRRRCRQLLSSTFQTVEIDDSGSKSISLSGGSLRRKVDVVPCNWFDTVRYDTTGDPDYRGIQVLDKDQMTRVINLPFLHNKMVGAKDSQSNGAFRRAVRLVKSLKADGETEIDISSYAITSLLYHMNSQYMDVGASLLMLVPRIGEYLVYVYGNQDYFTGLSVPNGTSKLSDHVSGNSLRALNGLMRDLAEDLKEDMSTVRKALSESISY